jgi:spore maturation protein CgeB
VRFYLDHPESRRRLAARGRARVLRDHTVRDRIRHMLSRAGLPASPPPAPRGQ